MFGTTLHWTTFFYALVDTGILIIVLFNYKIIRDKNQYARFIILIFLLIAHNITAGLLPVKSFFLPRFVQHILSYGVATALGVYMIYYLFKGFHINALRHNISIKRLVILVSGCFLFLFIIPYWVTQSLELARTAYTIPITLIALLLLLFFYKRISHILYHCYLKLKLKESFLVCMSSIVLLPILAIAGDYQWMTVSAVHIGFYAIIYMEISLYHHRIRTKLASSYSTYPGTYIFNEDSESYSPMPKYIPERLTNRQKEVALLILEGLPYKEIGKSLNIAENTVSKHASNIFTLTQVKNRGQFIEKYRLDKKSN